MSEFRDIPFVRSVFHPSDFSPESEHAFAHALAIALHGVRRSDDMAQRLGIERIDIEKMPWRR